MDLEVEAGKTHQKGPREAQGQDLEGRPKAVPPGLGDPEEEVKGEDQGQADLGVARGEAVPFRNPSSSVSPLQGLTTGRFPLQRPMARRPAQGSRSAARGVSRGVTSRRTGGRARQVGQAVGFQV